MNGTTMKCFCGGHGVYDDYNCGAAFEVTCPHCSGTGIKNCDCLKPSTKCSGRSLTEKIVENP